MQSPFLQVPLKTAASRGLCMPPVTLSAVHAGPCLSLPSALLKPGSSWQLRPAPVLCSSSTLGFCYQAIPIQPLPSASYHWYIHSSVGCFCAQVLYHFPGASLWGVGELSPLLLFFQYLPGESQLPIKLLPPVIVRKDATRQMDPRNELYCKHPRLGFCDSQRERGG